MILHLQILSTYDQLRETCRSASIIRTSLVLTGPPQPHSQMMHAYTSCALLSHDDQRSQ